MDFISGDSRNQVTLLPDSIEEYIDANNSARVIDAYINSLDLLALGFSRPQPNDTGRPMYDPKDLLKLYKMSETGHPTECRRCRDRYMSACRSGTGRSNCIALKRTYCIYPGKKYRDLPYGECAVSWILQKAYT